MSGKIIKIIAFPRIHVTLIGMNANGSRINGGFGFAIKDPRIEFEISESKTFEIFDERNIPLDENQLLRLKTKIESIKKELNFTHNINVIVSGNMPVHSGFGSGTIIRLACIEAMFIINNHFYNFQELSKFSGRGGTSGIGVRTYFTGGFVFDIGHKNLGQKLVPSSSNEVGTVQSLLLANGEMATWPIGICFPLKPYEVKSNEYVFFQKNASIDDYDVYQTLYHVVYEILAGVKELDIVAFNNGIKNIQSCKWKKSERELYNGSIEKTEHILYENGASVVGMSSLGPGLFFLGNDISEIISTSQHQLVDWMFFNTTAINSGRILNVNNA